MRGEIIYKILKSLKDVAVDNIDFMNAFIQAGYGASAGKINREFFKIKNKKINLGLEKEKILKFKKYLYKLKRDGLILENEIKQIYLSDKGKKRLENFTNSISLNRDDYKKEIGDKVIVISYDIPITFNAQRAMLRDILRMLGFNLIHKSVWIGKIKLPQRFIFDLKRLKILDYVEILEVTRNGTLKSKN